MYESFDINLHSAVLQSVKTLVSTLSTTFVNTIITKIGKGNLCPHPVFTSKHYRYMKKIILSGIFLMVSLLFARAQDCGTEVTPEQVAYMEQIRLQAASSRTTASAVVEIPVKVHIVRRGDGTDGLRTDRLNQLFDDLNDIYSPANMSFFIFGDINYVDDDDLFDMDQSEESRLAGVNDVNRVINLYFTGRLTSGSGGLCGYTRFPPSSDRVFVANGCANDVTTLAHEFGHYFNLYHTHGKTNNGTTDELVARVNCDRLGDNLCDTPADPNLSGQVSGNCTYAGNATDSEGVPFNPDPSNIMAYSLDACQNKFSNGQYERMRNGFEFGRNYLNYRTPNFAAQFTSDIRSGCAPLTISLTDNTSGASQRRWQFSGADKANSFSRTVQVTYDEPGIYNITLIVQSNGGEQDTLTREGYVEVLDPFENTLEQPEVVSSAFSADSLENNWTLLNADRLRSFELVEESADSDNTGSIFINNYEYSATVLPQVDALVLPNYPLGEISGFDLSFDYAYTFYAGEFPEAPRYDTLVAGYSLDCDNTIIELWREGGQQLATATSTLQAFVPEPNQWERVSVSVDFTEIADDLADFRLVKPLLANISNNGNNLYIDNIELTPDFSMLAPGFLRTSNIVGEVVEITWFDASFNESGFKIFRSSDGQNFEEIGEAGKDVKVFTDDQLPLDQPVLQYRVAAFNSGGLSEFSNTIQVQNVVASLPAAVEAAIEVYPNPASSNLFVQTGSGNGPVTIKVLDMAGRQMGKTLVSDKPETLISTGYLSSGMYLLVIQLESGVATRKFVIEQ